MDYKKSVKYLSFGVIAFFSLLAICIIIRPTGLFVNSGISYYGNFNETLPMFAVAFLVNSFLLWRAATFIGDKNKLDIYLKFVLKATAVLMIGILFTPYNVFNMTSLNLVHRTLGTAMFSIQMIMAISIVVSDYKNRAYIILIIMSFIGGYGALIYLLQPTGYMIEAQIIFQISVWLLFIRYLQSADVRSENRVADKITR